MRRAIAAQRTGVHRGVVAGELGGAGGAQAVAQARDHDLERLVGQADGRRRGRFAGPSGSVIE